METQASVTAGANGAPHAPTSSTPAEEVRRRLWWAATTLYARKGWIALFTLAVAIASVAISLSIPNRYHAETRLLLPESGGGLGALIGGVVPGASALFGGGGGYSRYLAILTSRTSMEEIVDRFGLVELYDTSDDIDPVGRAIEKLADRTTFDVSLDYDYLAVQVLDEDPRRASQIANAFVGILNRENAQLTSQSASANRQYLENRKRRAEVELDSLMASMQALQEQYGVIEPEAQSQALMASLADAQSAVVAAEVQYNVLRSELGPENPQVQAAAAGVSAARTQMGRLTAGAEAVMPVPMSQLPAVGRQYADLQQGLLLQRTILEEIIPLYEQAVLTERREADAVQVLDPAVPPLRKAEPRRSLMVLGAALSAFMIVVTVTLLTEWLRRNGPALHQRLRSMP